MIDTDIKKLINDAMGKAQLDLARDLDARAASIQQTNSDILTAELANFQNAVASLIEKKLAPIQNRLTSLIDEVAKNKASNHTHETATQAALLALQDDLNLLRLDTVRQIESATLSITQAHVARLMRRSEQK